MKTVFCLMGPTASGKTDLAVQLVQHYPFEIISVDSAMVYRGMDIGTAKPTSAELTKAPHHLINICDPASPYSAGKFRQDALQVIDEIVARDKIPLFVGGTMLYFNVLQNGVAQLPTADEAIRLSLNNKAKQLGWPAMHQQLQSIDPVIAKKLHPNDSQRIQRALEVHQICGKTMTELQKSQTLTQPPFQFINISIDVSDRIKLHQRIEKRFEIMLNQGFLEEVAQLKQRSDLHSMLPAIRTVGYRQAWSYLDGLYDQATMKQRAIIATRQLAKRQLTWLRRWKNLTTYQMDDKNLYTNISRQIEKTLNQELITK
jgi:tRNA dimethylallyltransferase